MKYTDPNAVELLGHPMRLRSFNGAVVGPTLRAKPGDTLQIALVNALPVNPDPMPANMNIPHNFNTTNLHTHGLHVSPQKPADYVLLEVLPQGTALPHDDPDAYVGRFDFTFQLPDDHPSGTFWYHPHRHGATAMQVASGMAGALIIEEPDDNRVPDELRNVAERILVLQEIPFVLDNGVGVVEDFEEQLASKEDRAITVNGKHAPTIQMRRGEVQRWRIIQAHFELAMGIRLHDHALHQIAADGITMPAVRPLDVLAISPGGRADVLVQANDTPGRYELRTAPYDIRHEFEFNGAPPPLADNQSTEIREGILLATVEVVDEQRPMPLPSSLPPPSGLPAIEGSAIARDRRFHFEKTDSGYQINGKLFDVDRTDEVFHLDVSERWILTAANGSHNFHIHQTPFRVMSVNGKPLARPLWRDTAMVPAGGEVVCEGRFEDFPGVFVVHCHRLKHEDKGMMQKVELL
ncbi:multicopper oxidase family protein [Mycobacterium spongiae]|uniref:multicopper oxidase family protein n=1 Tax=Mycobacterium spongiae TaxID=886343 RepID=UPI001BAC7864|nr:multicopper oxidase family protein [Mycobacterium spongiae]